MTDDDANRNSHSSHERVLTLASRSWHKTIMAQNDKYIPHRRSSVEDLHWLRQQDPCVQQLYLDCIYVEGFGDAFRLLETELSERSFRKAKKVLEGVLFEFEPICEYSQNNRLTVKGWKVRNIHGVHNRSYWLESNHRPTNYSVSLLRQNLPDEKQNLPQHEEVLPEVEPVAFDTTAFDSLSELKRNNNQLVDVVVSPFVEEDPNLVQLSATNPVELSPDPEIQNPSYLVKPNQPTCREKVNLSASMKSSAPAHVESCQNTSRSNEDAPQAPLGVQTSNPTPTTLSELTARFSLAVEGVLFDLDSALAVKGRQKEINDLLKLQKTLKSYDEQTILDAVRYVIEKLDSVKSLGAYLRKALEGSYKPSQQQIAQQTTKATQEEPKPYRGGLEGFLSESSIDLYNDANFSGWYLQQCDLQLRRDWHKGEAEHRTIICYWRSMQKAGVSPVI